ncbi:hypothetical protein M426DRAFT_15674 [Hypoxylon sp. CI-4A]|nr:hypothetical protein M426DRAFT_15674 [Hypoxylon sp. CI-4A]
MAFVISEWEIPEWQYVDTNAGELCPSTTFPFLAWDVLLIHGTTTIGRVGNYLGCNREATQVVNSWRQEQKRKLLLPYHAGVYALDVLNMAPNAGAFVAAYGLSGLECSTKQQPNYPTDPSPSLSWRWPSTSVTATFAPTAPHRRRERWQLLDQPALCSLELDATTKRLFPIEDPSVCVSGADRVDNHRNAHTLSQLCNKFKHLVIRDKPANTLLSPESSTSASSISAPALSSSFNYSSRLHDHPDATYLINLPSPGYGKRRPTKLASSFFKSDDHPASGIRPALHRQLASLNIHSIRPADEPILRPSRRLLQDLYDPTHTQHSISEKSEAQFGPAMADSKDTSVGLTTEKVERGDTNPAIFQGGLRDVDTVDSSPFVTPSHHNASTPRTASTSSYSGRMTRSMSKAEGSGPLEALPYVTATSIRDKLKATSRKPISHLSPLEDSRSIHYGDQEEDEGNGPQDEDVDEVVVSPSVKKRKWALTRRARLLKKRKVATGDSRDVAAAKPAKKRVRTRSECQASHTGTPRRSPRLQKALTEFHLYPLLPVELKLLIWEAAIEPRAVYICNRSSLAHSGVGFGNQNPIPNWFMACGLSVWVARLHYIKRFHLHSPWTGLMDRRTIQDVQTDIDIVIYEPCHSACRGCHCARHQYCEADRFAVRNLAIQVDSPSLPPSSEPCWQTITRSWENVETLYLMRDAVRGVDRRDKAIIRIKPNDHELELQKQFEEWKKGEGKNIKLVDLEFVVVVEKDNTPETHKRYQAVEERLTGLPEDVILG